MIETKKKNAIFVAFLFFFCCVGLAAVPAFAWFAEPKTDYTPEFDASIVKAYFDIDSFVDEADPTQNVFYITKPVHLYNLAYLTDKGVFTSPMKFQLGKQKKDTFDDTAYYVYGSNDADETFDEELVYRSLDMNLYAQTEGGIPAIGVNQKGDGSDTFRHAFEGNGIIVSNCKVKDYIELDGVKTYLDNVGLFGVISDGAIVRNINVDNLTLTTSAENDSTRINCGLLMGYIDQSDEGNITFERIGISDSAISTQTKVYSEFSLVGSGTIKGMQTANNFFTKTESTGDTGIINMGEIANTIRRDTDDNGNKLKDTAASYTNESGTAISYFNINGYYQGNLFDEYVLKDKNGLPSTKFQKGVDFKGHRVIKGTKENGIGVFDLVTASKDTDADFSTGLDKFAFKTLNYDGSQSYTKFYYSTAENYNAQQNYNVYNGVSSWSPSYVSSTDLSPKSFDAVDQSATALFYEASFDASAVNNYFYDTQYTYLRELFRRTLIDVDGNPVSETSPDFGVAAKYVASDGQIKNVENMHHVLKLSRYSGSEGYNIDSFESDGEIWVSSSVYFTLTRPANITIFAASKDSAQDSRVSIYSHDMTVNSKVSSPMRHPMYVMWVPGSNKTIQYYPEGGNDDTLPVQKAAGEALYAHTFRIPAGRYFVNVPDLVVSLMHISVQGQDEGDMGDIGKEGFAADFISSDETSILVGSDGYVYSQTAFVIDIQTAVAFEVRFIRIKDEASGTDIVYAYVADAGYLDYLRTVNEGRGIITATDPRAG